MPTPRTVTETFKDVFKPHTYGDKHFIRSTDALLISSKNVQNKDDVGSICRSLATFPFICDGGNFEGTKDVLNNKLYIIYILCKILACSPLSSLDV